MVYNEEEYELTENEKKAISNELEELLNIPDISNMTNIIKNSFVKFKYMYTSNSKIELQWYKLTKHFIRLIVMPIISDITIKITKIIQQIFCVLVRSSFPQYGHLLG